MAQYIKPFDTQDGEQRYEVVMLATGKDGSVIEPYNNLPVEFSPTQADAFGRLRVGNPFTLFDSFHRYEANGKFLTSTSVSGASATHDANASLINCTVDGTSGSFVYRETKRVFAYQPGKSLQILQTFVFSEPKENLRQRYGYFNTENGVFLQTSGTEISFVIRSKSNGIVSENKITQENWNYDVMDGTGPSKKTLDITKAQILFMDIEWLGVGSVRMGFVIDGVFILCHTFHHANFVTETYMTTACLPLRCEIENIGNTSGSSTMKEICSSVISEGGYDLRGDPRSIGTPLSSPKTLTTAGTFYPVVAIRLKSTRLDGIVLPKNIHLLGTSNTGSYQYKIIAGATITAAAGTWVELPNSSVEYNLLGTALAGGVELSSGYTTVSNQAATPITLDSGLFKYQLERDSFTSTAYTFVLAVAPGQGGNTVVGQIEWEEIT